MDSVHCSGKWNDRRNGKECWCNVMNLISANSLSYCKRAAMIVGLEEWTARCKGQTNGQLHSRVELKLTTLDFPTRTKPANLHLWHQMQQEQDNETMSSPLYPVWFNIVHGGLWVGRRNIVHITLVRGI